MRDKIKDLIIIGAGPAGLTAGIYAKRFGLDFLIIGETPGGIALEGHKIENYPGFKSISGADLMQKFQEQLDHEILQENVKKIIKKFKIYTDKNQYQAKSIILALGTKTRKLGLKNEEKFLGKGLSYCVVCDGPLFRDKIVAIVGGGNSALAGAVELADIAKKVYLIHRRDEFRAEPVWQERVKKNKKIEIIYNANLQELKGDEILEEIILDNNKKIKINGLFIEIGVTPNIALCKDLDIKTEDNYVIADKNQATNIKAVYAAGDITNNNLKQIITACAQGAIAASSVYNYMLK